MGTITVKIDDELEKLLRRKVGEKGVSKGALSKGIEEALKIWLGIREEPETKFIALLKGKKVAEDPKLEGLARKLKELKINPRDVIIERYPSEDEEIRMGLRYK
jgi:hypothetical protein